MEILYFLIPLSLLFVVLALGVFFWAVRSGQFEDLEGPAYRILFDDESPETAADGSNGNRRTSAGTDKESSERGDGRSAKPSDDGKQPRP